MISAVSLVKGPREPQDSHLPKKIILVFNLMIIFFVTGSVRDVTHHYPHSFYLGGGVTVLAALVLIPLTLKSHTSKIIEG